MRTSRSTPLAILGALLASTISLVSAPSAQGAPAAVAPVAAAPDLRMPNEVPSNATPWVRNGEVQQLAQVGSVMVAGGTFTSVSAATGSPAYNRTNIFAFNATTGAVSTTFVPQLNGVVNALLPGPQPNTVFVGGTFSTANGASASRVVLLNVNTGQTVTSFKAATLNGQVQGLALHGNRLFVAGYFTKAGGVDHGGLATLNASTGAVDPFMGIDVAGHHNDSGSGAQGGVGARKLAITPDGTRLVAIGNFKTADGLLRDQLLVANLSGTSAQVAADWSTTRYTPYCFKHAFDSYMRGLAMSADGSYFVVTATGGHNNGTLCDTAARWETFGTGLTQQPTWIGDSGGDTLWGVGITEAAVFIGGHSRWMNNPNGSDSAGQGAVPRAGLSALDPSTGVPLDWNPGRNPRGEAAYSFLTTTAGVWMTSDTNFVGDRQYRRERIAFFPYAGGRSVAPDTTGTLPGTVVVAGAGNTQSAALYGFDGSTAAAPTALATGIDWTSARGATMVANDVYYASSDGFLYKRSFDGTSFGPAVQIDPYRDPAWANVDTGSNNTYLGRVPSWYGQLSRVTALAYANHRMYYTLSGDNNLYWRSFVPDSGIISPVANTLTGGFTWSRAQGMFIDGSQLYVASSQDGSLSRVNLTATGAPTGSSTVVNSPASGGVDWRGRALFLSSIRAAQPNTPPTADFTLTCSDRTCDFDARGADDPDGSIIDYSWSFGDGNASGSGVTPSHTFSADGTYQVTLTVTDNSNATASATRSVRVEGAQVPDDIAFAGSAATTANSKKPTVRIPAGASAGDQLVLALSMNNLDSPAPSLAGWTAVGSVDSKTMRTVVWTRSAAVGDAGTNVSVTLDVAAKHTFTVAAYAGASSAVGTGQAVTTNGTERRTPSVSVPAGAWVVSYWGDKSASTTAWTPAASVDARQASCGDGAGHVCSLLADSGGPVPAGSNGNVAAATDAASGMATTWSVVLRP